MRWSELKFIVVLILVAANIFFAAELIAINADTKDDSAEKMNDTIVKILYEDGITLPRELLYEDSSTDVPVYICDASADYTDKIRETLTGTTEWVYDKQEDEGRTIQVSDGSKFYFGKDGSFEYTRLEYDILIEQILADDALTDADAGVRAETVNYLRQILSSSEDGDIRLSFDVDSVRLSETGDCIVAVLSQTLVHTENGISETLELSGNSLVCIISDGCLIYADGKWLFSDVAEVRRAQNTSLVNILLSVKKAVGNQRKDGNIVPVTVVEIGNTYCTYVDIYNGKSYIIPGRDTVFDDGTHVIVNSVNGEIYAMQNINSAE